MKNEAWILDRFLAVTGTFADLIVVADQQSTDGSRDICSAHPKVHLIDNPGDTYDEAQRQLLLLETARRLVPGAKLLLALDCDEILTADSVTSPAWSAMCGANPGTVLVFEKPALFLSPEWCDRGDVDFPAGFIDDGSEHHPSPIHSIRIPIPEGAPRLALDLKFMHYALLRPGAQKAKMRMYSAVENIRGTKSLYTRRCYYDATEVLVPKGMLQRTPAEWFRGWEERGIPVRSVRDEGPYWQDDATLELLLRHGPRRFWFDDIWEVNWSEIARGKGIPSSLRQPPRVLTVAMRLLFRLVQAMRRFRRPRATRKPVALAGM